MAPYRIAVSGPPGSGKTSLAAELAARHELPILPENWRRIYEATKELQRQPDQTSRRGTEALMALRRAYSDWTITRAREYEAEDGFVADRWEADLAAAWLMQFGKTPETEAARRLVADVKKKANGIDLAVILPPASWKVEQSNSEGMRRNPFFPYQMLSMISVLGLCQLCASLKILVLDEPHMSVAQRADRVEEAINGGYIG